MEPPNLKLAQEKELRVLISIYSNAVKDLRSKRDKRLRPPHFSLTITPLRSNSTIVHQINDPTFDLIVQETPLYPDEYDDSSDPLTRISLRRSRLPEISLANPRNLSTEALEECERELQLQMQTYLGEVLMTTHVRAQHLCNARFSLGDDFQPCTIRTDIPGRVPAEATHSSTSATSTRTNH
jgi:hypothetical protein